MGKRQALGKWGENLAAEYLSSHGYSIKYRNFRTPYGEIDLIAELQQGDLKTIIFVEVKTRTTRTYGPPEDAVNTRKRSHLLSAAQHYMQNQPDESNWRIDVIAIEKYPANESPELFHFENAFSE